MRNSLEIARLCAEAADNKKAFDILVLDLRGLTYITDYFVVCSASNITQVAAISDWVRDALAKNGASPSHVEGDAEANWVLMDYGDVVVHVFDEATRQYYSLEKLWGDAPRVTLDLSKKELQPSVP